MKALTHLIEESFRGFVLFLSFFESQVKKFELKTQFLSICP